MVKSFDISGLQAGVYVLRVIGDEGLITLKMVIN
ncbi:MAG: T9SS C-terminal target domain-containing protein [Bacteroidetes bacterium]|nr:MAG: T9SS C-terminal target domain-containing protein [Bacteroidota bacterium]